ncbi:alpha-2-macroglobulin family protein [Sediminibacterium salmoneum]|uniref:alpha-2-macroglobulin family protein n=1 Tax=Sediminibacterium salmoneum TaxID=426421 RepID=UPI00047D4B8F|nr:alpha-2-macroglobulin family protein [Sediminibacterium salmoneum]
MRLLFSLIVLLVSFQIKAQTSDTYYSEQYKIIDSLLLKDRLPKTALEKVRALYKKAVAEKKEAEQIRALIYETEINQEYTEEGYTETLQTLKKTSQQIRENLVLNSLLHVLIARKYNEYYENQRWNLYNRKNWNAQSLKDSIEAQFKQAKANASLLKNSSLKVYAPIIAGGSEPLQNYTVYDLLILEQIRYYSQGLGNEAGETNHPVIVALYKELIEGKKTGEAVQERYRFNFLKWQFQESIIKEKEYASALTQFTSTKSGASVIMETHASVIADAYLELARLTAEKGRNYHPFRDTANRYAFVNALTIIKEADERLNAAQMSKSGLTDLRNEIKDKKAWLQVEDYNESNKPFRAFLQFKNLDTLYGKLYKVSPAYYPNGITSEEILRNIQKQQLVREIAIPLPSAGDYQTHFTEFKMDPLKDGSYLLLTSAGKAFDVAKDKLGYTQFNVSEWVYVKDNQRYFIRNYTDGKPVTNASVTVFVNNSNRNTGITEQKNILQTKTDEQGSFIVLDKINNSVLIKVSRKNNELYFSDYKYQYRTLEELEGASVQFEKTNRRIHFFTDRSIYRPGQTINFKGIAITRDWNTKQSKLITDKAVVLCYLYNANRQKVDSISLQLNDFGSIAGQFPIPNSGLTGQFTIEAVDYNYSSTGIKIEEYKRPTLQLVFNQPKFGYRLNDSIHYTIQAMGYAGNVINGAKVVYTVKQYGRRLQSEDNIIASGNGITDGRGEFVIPFKALYDSTKGNDENISMNYIVQLTVTDLNGESRSGNINISAARTAWKLFMKIPPVLIQNQLKKIEPQVVDLEGKTKNIPVQTTIYKVSEPTQFIRKKYWEQSDKHIYDSLTYRKYFPNDEYNQETEIANWPVAATASDINQLEAGTYKVIATAIDSFGLTLKSFQFIQIINPEKPRTYPSHFQFYSATITKPGDSIQIVKAYPFNNPTVIQKIKRSNAKAVYQFVEKQNITKEELIISESDKGGIFIQEVFIAYGRMYQQAISISVPFNDKALSVKTGTFRNVFEPGSKESWQIEVEGSKANEKAAELLTGMYDASLDALYPHDWNRLNLWGSTNYEEGFSSNLFRSSYITLLHDYQCFCEAQPYEDPKLLSNIPVQWKIKDRVLYEAAQAKKTMAAPPPANISIRGTNPAMEESYDKVYSTVDIKDPVTGDIMRNGRIIRSNKQTEDQLQIRKNFNETAFFIPQLYADSTGKYTFSFQFPDATTQWKWMTLAHTKELAVGFTEQKVQTQKSLMVQPNLPRFLREGDQMEIPVKIANLTQKELTGTIVLELMDATTNTPVDGWFQNVFPQQYFTAEAGQSAITQFPVQIPFSYNKPLRIRIVAKTNSFSDGEEHIIPVLSNRQFITETLPIYLSKDTTQTFTFSKLLNNQSEGISTEALTVEYTTQPAWNAIQALSYMKTDPEQSAIQQFSRIYANLMALHILKKYPVIGQALDAWRKDSTALLNPLEKNNELKQILLEETPWVLDAKSGNLLLKELANQFNAERITDENEAWIIRLQKLQGKDGSFSWFEGGNADSYITNYILTQIGKLKRIGAIDPSMSARLRVMLVKANHYMDSEIQYRYKKEKTATLISIPLDYLTMRSLYRDIAITNDSAYQFYLKKALTNWSQQNLYGQAMAALLALRNNQTAFAERILKSLAEQSMNDTYKGVYWKNRTTSRWYAMPVQHQSMMIDCFSEINAALPKQPYKQLISGMLTWLIVNKEANHWGNSMSTTDAVYSIVANAREWFSNKRAVQIKLGNTTPIGTATEKAMEGSGYFKKRIEGNKVNASMGNITVTTATQYMISNQPSYGSIYWQYLANMDEITASKGELEINKTIRVFRNNQWSLLNENEPVKVGELMNVTLSIKTEREIDYVHVKDLRPAATEPTDVLSGYQWKSRSFYYQSTKDVSTNYYFHSLSRGTHQLDYTIRATHTGLYTAGIASVQSMYAPALKAHSNAIKIRIEQ